MNLLEYLQDERPESEKGHVVIVRGPPSFVARIPPRPKRIVPVKIFSEKTGE